MRKVYDVTVRYEIVVNVDESKFTPEFMQDFNETIYPIESVEDHCEELARRVMNLGHGIHKGSTVFLEGYGVAKEMGITAELTEEALEIDEAEPGLLGLPR